MTSKEFLDYSRCNLVNCTMERLQAYSSEKIDAADSTVMQLLSINLRGPTSRQTGFIQASTPRGA